jgi:FkbM family methyltransferase
MSISHTVLDASIRLGFYRPLRALDRIVRPRMRERLASHVELYRSLLAPSSLCIDVGANVGEMSDAMLRAGMRVLAFEPQVAVLPELLARCGDHPKFRLITAGVSNEPGVLTLFTRGLHGQSGFNREWGTSATLGDAYVPVIPLEYALRNEVPRYIKIDVEGWELRVLEGLQTPVYMVSIEFHLGLGAEQIEMTKKCLRRLYQLDPSYEVNVTPSERATLLWKQWRPLRDVLDWFPGDLRKQIPGWPYGDLFLRQPAR